VERDWRDDQIAELEAQLRLRDERIAELEAQLRLRDERSAALERQVAELLARLGQNSSNSHMPPSTDT
jgi:uncharacterized coiled-coil protein SlyX